MSYARQVVLAIICLLKWTKSSRYEERLLHDLFVNYSVDVRPVLNDTDAVNITFGITLNQILDVQEKKEKMVISTWTRQRWKNPLLRWDPTKYNGIKTINVKPSLVWKPDIVLYNNVDDDKHFAGNLDQLKTRIIISYDGNSTWLSPVLFKSKCDIDVTYFPFDTQHCPLKFGSWTYDKHRLDLYPEDTTVDLGKFIKNSEWRLDSAPANRSEVKYKCCPELFPDVTFTLVISRRQLFYQLNIVFPMSVISMLCLCSFLLPAESGERMSLVITLLLSMTVFMLVVADIVPATSEVVPLIGVFYKALMIEMVIMIMFLCYTMKLYHKDVNDPPMPKWMRKVVYDWLSYIVRVRVKDGNKSKKTTDELKTSVPLQISEQTFLYSNESDKDEKSNQVNTFPETGPIISRLDKLFEKFQMADKDEENKREWKIVAMTFDRCFLFIFLVVYLAITAVFIFKSPGHVE